MLAPVNFRDLALRLGCFFTLGGGLAGCRGIESLKQRCVSGETGACESACAKGVFGEGGCFHAGDQHRARAGLDLGSKDARAASEYFQKACDGGYGDGCLMLAQALESPYAQPGPEAGGPAAPRTISDADVLSRENRLSRACDHGSQAGCKRLGDVLIGKSAERALAAYGKACAVGAEPEACKAARAKEVAVAERWREACTHDVADDCARLGDLLFAVDPPRAMRLFVAEGQLRGVAELSSGIGGFVRGRVQEARQGVPAEAEPKRPAAAAGEALPTLDVLSPQVNGAVAIVQIDRVLHQRSEDLTTCMVKMPRGAVERFSVHLVVDLTGDVWRATATPAPGATPAGACLEAALEAFAFGPPGPPAPAFVDLTLAFTSAPVPAPSPPGR
jgi:hypothetical protein